MRKPGLLAESQGIAVIAVPQGAGESHESSARS
jgi:hypothetical protein